MRQAAWNTKCDDEASLHFNVFLACPVEPTRRSATHSIFFKREHQRDDVVYLKTETKLFTQNAYLLHFLEGHLSLLHSIQNINLAEMFVAGHFKPTSMCICMIELTVKRL